ncbi:MAG TPA: hypothetical protein VHS31_12280 [Tepidisphaeraceae bacterium]|nr:hypothetical protein [Tepidisphaeraceae bacterium]
MTFARKCIVYGLLVVLLAGHGLDVVKSKEHWPFSPYPMYADLENTRSMRMTRMVGVTATRPPREVVFNAVYLRNSLSVWETGGQVRKAQVLTAAREFLANYNKQMKGIRKDRRLAAIRVYEYVWYLNPNRSKLGDPDEKHLLAVARSHQVSLPPKSSKKKIKPAPKVKRKKKKVTSAPA